MRYFFLVFSFIASFGVAQDLDYYLDKLKSAKSDTQYVNSCNKLTDWYYRNKFDSTSINLAINEYGRKALKKALSIKYFSGAAEAYFNIGSLYFKTETFLPAFENLMMSYRLSDSLSLDFLKARTANKLGYIHNFIMNNQDNALPYFQEALSYFESTGEKVHIARLCTNIGSVFSVKKNDELTIKYYLRAYSLFMEVHDSLGLGVVSGNISDEYIKQGLYEKAFKFTNISESFFKAVGNKTGIAYCKSRLGIIYFHLGEIDKAEENANLAFEFANSHGNLELIKAATEYLTKIYKGRSMPEKAMYYENVYYKTRDSLGSIEKSAKIAQIETAYKVDKLQQEKNTALLISEVKNEQQRAKQRLILLGVVLILLIVVIFSFLLFKRFKVISNQNIIINKQKEVVEEKNYLIAEKQKEILDSIHYAKRIQYTLLANKALLESNLPDHFILFNPKDIVSGDFYWGTKRDNFFFLAICDSTGHGVPGAFMSLMSIGFLNEAINEKGLTETNDIFDFVKNRLIASVGIDGQKDGFDGVLLRFERSENKLNSLVQYSAANNAPVVISKDNIEIKEKDRMPVGPGVVDKPFSAFTIELSKGDKLYVYTDGFADQFGGQEGKKFKYKQLNKLLLTVSNKPFLEQEKELNNIFHEWKGNLEQIDDVCMFGMQFI
ncbi:MAG: SpoIIE family protein phosphatase [Bacteroidia bacterium]